MRLSLRFPESWIRKFAPDDKVAAILPGDRTPQAIITYGRIQLLPDEPRAWQMQVVHSDLPPDSKVVIGRTVEVATITGWPMRLIEAEVRSKTGDVIELRVCAFYSFLEHTAAAIVRTDSHARLESLGNGILDILGSGRPDWSGDEIACLADAWNLETRRSVPTTSPEPSEGYALVQRASELMNEGRASDALAELERAIALDPRIARAHGLRGVVLGTLGDHAGAIEAWDRALAIEPDRIDTIYNRAQARYLLRDFVGALGDFERAAQLEPDDLQIRRKVIQCLYALERLADGDAARVAFRDRWAASTDPRVQRMHEYVFDQVAGDDFTMFAIETLRPRNPNAPTLVVFTAVKLEGEEEIVLPATVFVETSQIARASGTPFIICVRDATKTRVVSTLKDLPPYAEMRKIAFTLLQGALKAP